MRKFLAAAAAVTLLAATPMALAATAKPDAEQALLLKKKKAEAARKAEAEARRKDFEARKAAARKVEDARRKKDVALLKAQTRKAEDKLAAARAREAARRSLKNNSGTHCTGFFNCMFGASPRASRPARSGQAFAFASYGGQHSVLSSRSMRREVSFSEGKYAPGSLIVKTPERALYYVLGNGKAVRYPVGVGREGFQWSGNSRIAMKREWPEWRPPQEMIEREAAKGHILPEVMEGGPDNPLGARAMYIAGTIYRVHGTNNEASIGGAVSSGCIRMMNADVIDLYNRVKVGSRIYVYQ